MRFSLLILLALPGCGPKPVTMEDFQTRLITLPDGRQIRAEVVTNPIDMMRGMMFRDSLAADRGMLFVHGSSGNYPYWMYNVRIPLDIVWLDPNRRVVEISADTPPCQKKASECPSYGGHASALFVLELAGGQAARHRLKLGDTLAF